MSLADLAKPRTVWTRERRRHHIVAVGARLFMERGYETSSINELAAAVEMSVGGLYRYIRTKADLLEMVCEDIYGSLPAELEQAAGAKAPVERRLSDVAQAYLASCLANHELILLMYREYRHLPADAKGRYREREEQVVQIFVGLIEEGQRSARFRPTPADLAARDIVLLGHLPALKGWSLGRRDAEELVAEQLQIIERLSGVQRRASARRDELPALEQLRWSAPVGD